MIFADERESSHMQHWISCIYARGTFSSTDKLAPVTLICAIFWKFNNVESVMEAARERPISKYHFYLSSSSSKRLQAKQRKLYNLVAIFYRTYLQNIHQDNLISLALLFENTVCGVLLNLQMRNCHAQRIFRSPHYHFCFNKIIYIVHNESCCYKTVK